jgi:hypothetical protein
MAIRGLKSRVRAPSSTANLEMCLVVSRLWRISANGKSVTTEMLYASKYWQRLYTLPTIHVSLDARVCKALKHFQGEWQGFTTRPLQRFPNL